MPALLAAIDSLRKTQNSCARLSVWHTRAYVIGVQTALLVLNCVPNEDAKELGMFAEWLHKKFGNSGSEYDAVWLHASSPKESADIYVQEWEAFLKARKLAIAETSSEKVGGMIDLTEDFPRLEAKPGFYFATPDITHLKAWIDGVRFVSKYFGEVRVQPDIDVFDRWLRDQSLASSSCPWDMILTSNCGGNTSLAFSKFFEEVRRFVEDGNR